MQHVFIVTASRTADGRAVYLTETGSFSPDFAEALSAADEGSHEEALRSARSRQDEVCDPYLMRAEASADGVVPTSARERIRAAGPRWIAERFGYAI